MYLVFKTALLLIGPLYELLEARMLLCKTHASFAQIIFRFVDGDFAMSQLCFNLATFTPGFFELLGDRMNSFLSRLQLAIGVICLGRPR